MKKQYTLILLALSAFKGHARQSTAAAETNISSGQLPLSSTHAKVREDSLDTFILGLLQKRQIPGLSLAVIQDGKIVKARAYGFIDKTRAVPVTETTLFQAGSISKSVAAAGALLLVEKNKLSLDEDVNIKLQTWKVPENEFTKDKKVTLRGLLSHTAGLTVHGFPGYNTSGPIPSVPQILDGTAPANTAPVRVDFIPGSQWRYSGGGYTIMQQLILDVTGRAFPQYMEESVLAPLSMSSSTYAQPLSAEKAKLTATAHSGSRDIIDGRWHIYPEMAAAGLWTTPSDLARFAISIQNGFVGRTGSVLSPSTIRQMLTNQKNNDGLGVFLEDEGQNKRFGHGGRDEGFDALMTAGVETGQGAVIMINANDNSRMMNQIVNAIAIQYHWKGFPVNKPISRQAVKVAPALLSVFEGRYELENNRMITFQSGTNRLFSLSDGFPDEEFVALSATQFASTDRDVLLTFDPDTKNKATGFVWKNGNDERKIPRIGPLFAGSKTTSDPDPVLTEKIKLALEAMHQGGNMLGLTPGIAAGTKRAFAQGVRDLNGVQQIRFVHSENVKGRGIQRHDSDVSEIATYLLPRGADNRYVLVYLTDDALITDCDVVNK